MHCVKTLLIVVTFVRDVLSPPAGWMKPCLRILAQPRRSRRRCSRTWRSRSPSGSAPTVGGTWFWRGRGKETGKRRQTAAADFYLSVCLASPSGTTAHWEHLRRGGKSWNFTEQVVHSLGFYKNTIWLGFHRSVWYQELLVSPGILHAVPVSCGTSQLFIYEGK